MKRALAFAALLFGAAFVLSGCTPELGDKCVLSTDCSLRGDRTCDTSQPGGYCTIRDCRPNGCPDEGACVLFEPTIPGCGFDTRSPSRVARSYCMAHCEDNTDCRDGYICADPKAAPWFGVIVDSDTGKRVCIIPPSGGASLPDGSATQAPVCGPVALDAGTLDARSAYDTGAPTDAGTDGDAEVDASDAGVQDGATDADAGPSDAAEAG